MINGISNSTASLSEMRQQMFNKIDTNADGSIDKSEITARIEENASILVSSFFGAKDTDQDSLISMIEFNSEMAKLGQEMKSGHGASAGSGMQAPPPPPEEVFDKADTNEDGIVTKEELTSVMGRNGENVDELFSQVDADGDGIITRTEDESFRSQMMPQREPGDAFGAGMQDNGLNFQAFNALVQLFASSSGASGQETSIIA